MSKRKAIKEWTNIARKIVLNPRAKVLCPSEIEIVEYQIINYPKFNKIEIKMKCNDMKDFVTVTMDME